MGKGARMRTQREESRKAAREYLDQPEQRKAMRKEIDQQLAGVLLRSHQQFRRDETAVILWTLHQCFGFGAERLRRYFDQYDKEWQALSDHYEATDEETTYLAVEQLKRIGVDLDEWMEDEYGKHT